MLRQLNISNYALIARADIDFQDGMSVITGETGAGKSILLGALSLLLGQKADVAVLLDKTQKCVVEATFDIEGYGLQQVFEAESVDYDNETIIRREILPGGKSRAFVNDTPVNVSFLKQIGQSLIDIHSQHQNMLLAKADFQLDVVDSMAGTTAELQSYATAYSAVRRTERELAQLKQQNDSLRRELDYNKHRLAELDKAQLKDPDELPLLETKVRMAERAEEIKLHIATAVEHLSTEESGVVSMLLDSRRQLDKIADFLPAEDNIVERIESARIDLDDIAGRLKEVYEKVDFDPEEARVLTDRLNMLDGLLQKNSVDSLTELIALREELRTKVSVAENFDETLRELSDRLKAETAEAFRLAEALSAKRATAFENIASSVCEMLRGMGMPNAQLVVSRAEQPLSPTGADDIRFLFAANKNGQPTEISRVASGGEISRVMLSIKALLSQSKKLPTIIFDEIDTGVSGDVASRMGSIMRRMAANMQVITITHLPQVAVHGMAHYRVFKQDTVERTLSHIEKLSAEARTTEIAKMLSGSDVSEAALANARALLGSVAKE